jgi:hypothetical protein
MRIEQELKYWRDQATAELEFRQRLEHELNQVNTTNQSLQRELQKSTATAEYFRDNTYQHMRVTNSIMELVEGLKTRTNSSEGLPEFVPLLDSQ